MEVWAKYKWTQVKTSKKAANDLAKAHKAGALPLFKPVSQETAPLPKEDAAPISGEHKTQARAGEVIKAKVLQIRRVVKF